MDFSEGSAKCSSCPFSCTSEEDLFLHARKCHEDFEEDFEPRNHVEVCPIDFVACEINDENDQEEALIDQLDINPDTEQNNPEYTCEVCTLKVPRKDLLEHMRQIHNLPYKWRCLICNQYEIDSWQDIKEHEASHGTDFRCPNCDTHFKKHVTFKKHMLHPSKSCVLGMSKPKISGRPTTCKECSESFPNRQAMRRHILEAHKNIELFECDLCSIILPTMTYLNLHRRKKHKLKCK